jgi:hypothetical protein
VTFNPLGSFDVNAPLNQAALAGARAFAAQLPAVPHGAIDRIYGHWTVGHRDQNFGDYNGAARFDGMNFHLDIVGDPRDNAIGVNDNEPHPHTYHRNTGAFGFATDDMAGANEHDFGPEPVTIATLEWLCAGVAAVAHAYGIDLSGTSTRAPYAGEPTFLTHAEAADRVGSPPQYAAYGPASTSERWDLASFVAFPAGLNATGATAKICGDALRARAHAYKVALG